MAVGSSSQNKSLLAPSPVSRGNNVSLASCAEAGMSSLQFSEKNCGKISEKNCVSEGSLVSITGQHAALSVQITSFSSSLTLVCASSESVSETVDSAEKSPQNAFFPYSKGCGHQPVRNLHPGNNIGKKCSFDTQKSCQSEDTKEEHPSSDMGGVDGLIKLSNEYNSHFAAKRTDIEMQLNHAKKCQLHNDGDIQGIGGSNQEDSNGDIMLADEDSDDGTQFAGKDDVSDEDSDNGTQFVGKDGDVSDEDSDDGIQFAGKDDVSDEDSDDGIQFASKDGDVSDEDSGDGVQFAGKDGDVSDEDSDDGIQFASKDGDSSDEDSDDGIQFASKDGDSSDEDSDDGIQFAGKDGDVSDEDSDDGIQFAGKDGDSSDEDSDDGIQFAGEDGDSSDEDSDDGIQFAGKDGDSSDEDSDDGTQFASKDGDSSDEDSDDGIQFADDGDASDSDENSDGGIQFGDEDCDIHVSVDDSDDDIRFGDYDSSDDENDVQFSADEILFASKKIDKEDDEVVSFNGTIVEFSCSSSSQSSSFVHQTTLQSTTVVSSCRPKKGFPKKKKKHCKVSSYINVDDMDSDDDLGMGISFEIPSSKNSAKKNKTSKKKEEKKKSQDTIFSDEEMSPETLDANRRWNEFYSSVEIIDDVVLEELFIAQKEIVSIDIPDPSLYPSRSILKKPPCPSLQIEVFVLSEVKNDGSSGISSDKNPSFPLKGEGADEFDGTARSKPLRVSFNLSPLTLEMDESNVDRKGLWVQHAIDRMRFMEMITMKFKPVLTPILCLEHRQKIRKRFFDEWC